MNEACRIMFMLSMAKNIDPDEHCTTHCIILRAQPILCLKKARRSGSKDKMFVHYMQPFAHVHFSSTRISANNECVIQSTILLSLRVWESLGKFHVYSIGSQLRW